MSDDQHPIKMPGEPSRPLGVTTAGEPEVEVAAAPDVVPSVSAIEFRQTTQVSYETPVMPAAELERLHNIDDGGYAKQVIDLVAKQQSHSFSLANDESRREDRRLDQREEELRLQALNEKGERDQASAVLLHQERMLDKQLASQERIAQIQATSQKDDKKEDTSLAKRALTFGLISSLALTGAGIGIAVVWGPTLAVAAAFTAAAGFVGVGAWTYRKITTASSSKKNKALPATASHALPPPQDGEP